MTEHEWAQITSVILANWPQSPPPAFALEKWYSDLADLPATQVLAAVETLSRDGREFPPNGAIIRKRVTELALDVPDHGRAFELVWRAASKFGADRWTEAREWLATESPVIAIAAGRFGWREFCRFDGEESHLRAQFRDTFNAVARSAQRDASYAGIAPSGLAALERGKPRRLGEIARELTP